MAPYSLTAMKIGGNSLGKELRFIAVVAPVTKNGTPSAKREDTSSDS